MRFGPRRKRATKAEAPAQPGAEATAAAGTPRSRVGWPVWVVAIFFAVLYSYALWAGIGNAVGLPQVVRDNYNMGVSVEGWILLGVGVIVSPAVYVCCLLLGRRRGLMAKALIYLAGLCVVSAVLGSLIVAPTIVNFTA